MKIGDRVTDRYGWQGKVIRFYDDFSAIAASCLTMTGQEWLAMQEQPIPEACLKERWVGVEIDCGGAIWSPESLLTPDPAPLAPGAA